jgi:hypothetical protein
VEPEQRDRLRRISAPIVIGLLGLMLIFALRAGRSQDLAPSDRAFGSAGASTQPLHAGRSPVALPPRWPQRLTLYTDSVGLGAVTAIRDTMPDWRIKVLGRPALKVDVAAAELADSGDPVDRVVVVALGYNSLWEPGREDFEYWSRLFDQNAAKLLRALRAAGARKIVWVTLRDAPRSSIPTDALEQNRSFAWYFPWVNERLRALDDERSEVVLADWSTVGDRRNLTYDAIHLDPDGALRYARMVERSVLDEPFTPYRPHGG